MEFLFKERAEAFPVDSHTFPRRLLCQPPFKLICSITVTELEDTAKEKIAPSAFHFHSLRTLSLIKKMNLHEQCSFRFLIYLEWSVN